MALEKRMRILYLIMCYLVLSDRDLASALEILLYLAKSCLEWCLKAESTDQNLVIWA